MKKLLLASLSLATLCPLYAHELEEHPETRATRGGIVLTSPLLGLIDGLSFGINANHIKMMLMVHRELKKIMFGEADKTGALIGRYTFNGSQHSIRSLVLLETLKEEEYRNSHAALSLDAANKQKIADLESGYKKFKKELEASLLTIKKDFEQKVAPFEKNARGAKEQMLVLIAESCQKHGHPDSYLLKWADTQEGNEMVYVRDHLHSFKEFDQFCSDLLNFLEDLMRSCPKAWNQFKQQLDAAKQNQAHK